MPLRRVAVLPGGARFVSGGQHKSVKLCTLDGTLERTFEVGGDGYSAPRRCPTACTLWSALAGEHADGEVWLYHVDGTLVHTFKGLTGSSSVYALAVTPDGQHIISGGYDGFSQCVERRQQEPSEHLRRRTITWLWRWRRCPTASASSAAGPTVTSGCGVLDGTRQKTIWVRTRDVRALVALPDNQHAISGSDDSSSKLFNVNDGAVLRTFTHHRTTR